MSSDPAVVTVRADQGHALKCELAAESLRLSGRLRLRVTGWSMLPTICPGDTLIIERADARARAGAGHRGPAGAVPGLDEGLVDAAVVVGAHGRAGGS